MSRFVALELASVAVCGGCGRNAQAATVGSLTLRSWRTGAMASNVIYLLEAAQSCCLRSAFRNAPMAVGSHASGQMSGSVRMVPSQSPNAGKLTEIKTETSTRSTRSSGGSVLGRGIA